MNALRDVVDRVEASIVEMSKQNRDLSAAIAECVDTAAKRAVECEARYGARVQCSHPCMSPVGLATAVSMSTSPSLPTSSTADLTLPSFVFPLSFQVS